MLFRSRGVRRQPRQRVRERRRAPRGDDESVVPVPDRLLGSEGVGADDREPRSEGLAGHDRVGLPHNGGENKEVVEDEDALDLLAPVLRANYSPFDRPFQLVIYFDETKVRNIRLEFRADAPTTRAEIRINDEAFEFADQSYPAIRFFRQNICLFQKRGNDYDKNCCRFTL